MERGSNGKGSLKKVQKLLYCLRRRMQSIGRQPDVLKRG